MCIHHAAFAVLIAAPLVCQDAPVPAKLTKPLLILEMDGPNALRGAFLPTNVGTMLASREARSIWPDLWDRLNRSWYGEGKETLLTYGGRVRVLAFIDPGPPQRERGIIVLEPDGQTALADVAERLSQLLRDAAQAAPVDRKVAGWDLTTVYLDTPGILSLPREINGRMVSFFGSERDMDWVVEAGVETLKAPLPKIGENHPLSLHVDLEQLARLAREESPGNQRIMDEIYALSSLGDLQILLRNAGPQVMLEVELGFRGGERGIFAGLMPDTQQRPTLVSMVPKDGRPWAATRLDVDSLVRTALSLLTLALRHGSAPEDPLEEIRQDLKRDMGFDVFDDLLAHFGDEVLVLRKPGSAPSTAEMGNLLTGMCLGIRIHGTEPVRTNLLKLLEEAELPVQASPQNYKGVPVQELPYPDGSGAAYCAVTADLLLFAFDDLGLELLHGVLDARRTGARDLRPPHIIRRTLNRAPLGLNGMGVVDISTLMRDGFPFMGMLFGFGMWRFPIKAPGPDEDQPANRVLTLLENNGLGDVVFFTGYHDNRWHLRLIW